MREGELTYDDFLRRLNIQDVLIDAGYHLNRRDGLRYPSYVRLDSEGRRIRNDKFIVTQQGKCCFKPQQQKSYNIISFIKEHPHFFAEYHAGVSPDRLVNLVCNRLLNHPVADRDTRIIQPKRDVKPFDMADYDIHQFNPQDRATQKKFYPFFKHRGIDLYTQYAFHRNFCLATKHREDGMKYTNLAFPLTVPKDTGQVVGLEERGRPRMDGSGSYKGVGTATAATGKSMGKAVLHPSQTLRGAGQAVKTATIGGAVGYVGWEKLTTDKSVVRIVSDAVVGESVTDTIAGTADGVRELTGKAGEAVSSVSGAVTGIDNKLNGVSNFLRQASGGGGLDMFGNFFRNLGSGNVSGLSIAGLVAAAFLIFGRFGWLGKIAGAFLGMMLIGNNAGVFRTPETENVQRTRTPELPAEEQTHGGGMRR